jgi:hypothetical protein
MKKLVLLLFLAVLSFPTFCQQKATFKSITERITPYQTNVWELKDKFKEVPVDTVVGLSKWREIYFKQIGIGILVTKGHYANMVTVHLKHTNQKSKEYFFKRNLTVGALHKKLGKPSYFSYSPAKQRALLRYGDKLIYEVYQVELNSTSPSGFVSFEEALPILKKRKLEYLYIDLGHATPPPVKELIIEETDSTQLGY